ncbi:hypothetical protein FSARC_11232 [Fusarium sarcochroum]|uniref:Rhodopsin domain-containing protein n=1 Tax=Fusarium sarcochroum TaxID=1208366 RepID=A0A8H4TGN7_9HYPO|nr:hypothetical protein FSARC_11232 [Fusarium sarcochroum]
MTVNKAPMALGVMWSLAVISEIFVFLRLYTRTFIVKSIGLDDHAYWLSGVLILLYTAFVSVSARYGFGQSMPGPDALPSEFDDAALAIKYEMIGQTFAVIGMAVAKLALGFFLLRIVVAGWHKILISAVMISLSFVSILTDVMFWIQCRPVVKIFDPIRVPGTCGIDVTPFAITLGISCAIADFFFAIFPWFFIWRLKMKRKDKITIAGSMSLGIIAGICGIYRTYEVATGFTANYTFDTVPLIIWSSAEMAITLVCMGIPTLRPFWRRVIRGLETSSDKYYKNHGEGSEEAGYKMGNMAASEDLNGTTRPPPDTSYGLDHRGAGSITQITGNNRSDEAILGTGYRETVNPMPKKKDIHVKNQVRIDWAETSAM